MRPSGSSGVCLSHKTKPSMVWIDGEPPAMHPQELMFLSLWWLSQKIQQAAKCPSTLSKSRYVTGPKTIPKPPQQCFQYESHYSLSPRCHKEKFRFIYCTFRQTGDLAAALRRSPRGASPNCSALACTHFEVTHFVFPTQCCFCLLH